MKERIIKTFGGGSWIRNSRISTFEDADIVIMPGGGDWNPALYGQKPNKGIRYSEESDSRQMALINKALDAGKYVWGNCRGLQGVTIRNGGFLLQDVSHPSSHFVKTQDGFEYTMNSCHHQMCIPYNLPKEDYEVISWTEQLSNRYITENEKHYEIPEIALNEGGLFKEPEIIWFPKTKSMGCQGHAEWLSKGKTLDFINDFIREKIK